MTADIHPAGGRPVARSVLIGAAICLATLAAGLAHGSSEPERHWDGGAGIFSARTLPAVHVPESLWTQAQTDAAATSGISTVLWAEISIYGGFDDSHEPVAPARWDRLAELASIPVQSMIGRRARTALHPQPLRLHRPDQIGHRFLYQYDAWLSNVIYVEHVGEGWDGRFFDFHFLEEVFIQFDPAVTFRNNRRLNDNLFLWSRPAGWDAASSVDEYLFYMIQRNSIDFECAGRVWTDRDRMLWEAIVVNHSAHDWVHPTYHAPGALMCFRTRNNPDFQDTLGERTHYHAADGRRLGASVFDLDGASSIYFHQWTFLGGLYGNVLTRFNQSGTLWATARSEPARSVSGNRAHNLSCIHPNVGWSIPRGGYQKIQARIDFGRMSGADPRWLAR